MKLDFDITTAEYAVIRDILVRFLPPDAKVWVFGSRAKGTARFNSDLDLAIESKGTIAQSQIYALKEAFNDAPISFRVDIVDLAQVDAGFRKIIEEHRVSFPLPEIRHKHLRFPEFAGKWEEARFDYWFKINAGGDVPEDGTSRKKTSEFPFPVFANSTQNRGLYGYARSYREEGDCVTVSGRGELGIPNARHEPFVPIVRLLVLRPRHPSDVDFFENAILRTRIFVESTGVPQLTGPQLSSYRIAAPSLPEQKKIAAFLGVVDAKIVGLRAKVAGLETYKRGLMQALFSQRLRFTKPNGTAFPDWEEKKLGEVCNIDWGNTSTTKASYDEFGEFLAVSASGGDGRIAFYEHEAFTPVLSAIGALCGKMFLPTERFTAIKNTIVFTRATNNLFLYYALLNFSFPIQGAGQSFIGKKDLEKSKIIYPHPDEQQKIADALSAMDARIQAASAQVTHMETFKKGLLQQMFV